ncbi:DUF3369 domain-containing protein [Alteromonas sediminis]|uniref:DUF3369 domain-containing protein n=1 Tax=Alteromonas sediminis TaxID=2259342 RepID=A0A3N5Y873_9ALTE|nr:DUF3369 domain-containing protein [Alteromonas sediminis]RPJ67179.1 DUF3369 domain-containing protein [Alteromonas sediminis]
MNDEFLFAEDDDDLAPKIDGTWKILIVDDEPEIHAVTKLALSEFVLNGKSLNFLSAYSGEEAINVLKAHDDIAVMLLDVVMETDDAGLRVADRVRNELNNSFTRIILRTGQPGQAPEKEVIVNYDINDYKSKTELTAQKLFTVIIAALRSYRDIISIEESRVGLEKVVQASTDLFSRRSLEQFMEGLIQQLSSVLGCSQDAAYITSAVAGHEPIMDTQSDEWFIFAGNGEYSEKRGKPLAEALGGDEFESCQHALASQDVVFADNHIVAYCGGQSKYGSLLYLSGLNRQVNANDKHLIDLFSQNVQVAFENVMRIKKATETQARVLDRLCNLSDVNGHGSTRMMRLVAMADFVAGKAGLNDSDTKELRMAIPLMGLEHSCLAPVLLNDAGVDITACIKAISEHAKACTAETDYEAIPFLKKAMVLSRQHHEKWDGSGYPQKLSEAAISVESMVVAAVYMFDTLLGKQTYKSNWSIEDVVAFFKEERGKAFSPQIADIVIEHHASLVDIENSLSDDIFQKP